MAALEEIVAYCDARVRRSEIADFPGARNGLQVENNGRVSKIGASVDAGWIPFRDAVAANVDCLICHHGLFWAPPIPVTGTRRAKLQAALEGNLAVYGAHLPLDCHPEIGNNALLAQELGLRKEGTFLSHEGTDIGLLATPPEGGRDELARRLRELFPATFQAVECGPDAPGRVAILTGSGSSAVDELGAAGADTLVTGELRQHHFNAAQELGLNLYPVGHYATETFGVRALAAEVAEAFGLESVFLPQECPL